MEKKDASKDSKMVAKKRLLKEGAGRSDDPPPKKMKRTARPAKPKDGRKKEGVRDNSASVTENDGPAKKERTEKRGKEVRPMSSSSSSKKRRQLGKENEVKNEESKGRKEKASTGAKRKTKKEGKVVQAQNKKEDREKQKRRKEERQKQAKSKDVYALGVEVKKMWETLRREDCQPEERTRLTDSLHKEVKGKLMKLLFAHDTVRPLECLVALGSDKIREDLFGEVKDCLVSVAKAPYGHFFLVKLLKYGSKDQRAAIFKTFQGRVADLTRHKVANNIVESLFNEYANAQQRNHMLQEFCGPEFRAFKEDDVRTVAQLIEKHPMKKKDIVRHLGDNVNTLVQKGCYNQSLVHTVIYNYLQVCSPKQRGDTIEQLRDVCLHVLHSHDGARLSMLSLWYGTSKDRKAIVKSFKTFVTKICTEEHGHMVMLALFDCVDDTKLVGKAILGEIADNLDSIAGSDHGRKVLMYLMSPRDTTYFHPQVIDILKQGDQNPNSKKDTALRARELRESASPALCRHLSDNLTEMLASNSATLLVSCVLRHASPPSAVEPVLDRLAEAAARPFCPGEEENLVERPATHMVIKKLIQHDKVRREQDPSARLFSAMLLGHLDEDGLESWVTCNRGAFLFVVMLETGLEQVSDGVRAKVKLVSKTLQRQKTKGAEVLRKKL